MRNEIEKTRDLHQEVCAAVTQEIGEEIPSLEDYARKDRRFQHLLLKGIEPGAWVAVERDLIEVVQIPSGTKRLDLQTEIEAMKNVPEMVEVLEKALGANVDIEEIEKLGGLVLEHSEEASVIQIVIEGRREWNNVLGGISLLGEIERVFTLHIRRAPWRDRQGRRLSKLTVQAIEMHADPVNSEL